MCPQSGRFDVSSETQRDDGQRPGGVPASPCGDPVVDLLAGDYDDRPRGVHLMLLDAELARGRRSGPSRTVEEVWIEEPGTLHGGRWERI
jgi:hypothetical protein